jgi:hypothetical protein
MLQNAIEKDVGGFLGMGTSKFSAEFVFDKNEYYVGEKPRVKVICDNSTCKCDVKNFKFKLHRSYKCKTNLNIPVSSSDGAYISALKFPGCKAGEKVEHEFELEIPVSDLKIEQNSAAKQDFFT